MRQVVTFPFVAGLRSFRWGKSSSCGKEREREKEGGREGGDI